MEQVERLSKQDFGCSPLYHVVGENFTEVFLSNPPNVIDPDDERSNVMDLFAGKDLVMKRWNLASNRNEDILLKEEDKKNLYLSSPDFKNVNSINYFYDYLDFSLPTTIYTSFNDSRIPTGLRLKLDEMRYSKFLFKEWRYNGATGSPLTFDESRKACEGTHKVRVFNGMIRARIDKVDERHGVSTFGSRDFRMAQPTWCNVFARVLSRRVFGQDAFPAMGCINLFNEVFTVEKSNYVEITGKNKNENYIWALINKGFPVYFISTGHIETGFPDMIAHSKYRYRYELDPRYQEGVHESYLDSNQLYESSNETKNLVVGAGKTVGFKEPWSTYSWLKKDYTKTYLYLGYLRNIY